MRARWFEPLLATLVALGIGEGALRLAGLGPWQRFESFDDLPRLSEPDSELGWVNRPGHHAWVRDGARVEVFIDPDGTRGRTTGRVGLFGGSFVYGFGLSDPDTVGARLHAQRPDLGVQVHAVPGYGTLQSVLAYERLQTPPEHVVYGLVGLHDGRNAPASSWLRALEQSAVGQAWVAVPGARWDGQALTYTPPVAYRHWAWSERLALVDVLERARNAVSDRFLRTKSETTIQLIRRFRDAVQADGGTFHVALLHAPEREDFYVRRLEAEHISWVDARHPELANWSIPGDGHPDARIHDVWARRLAEAL